MIDDDGLSQRRERLSRSELHSSVPALAKRGQLLNLVYQSSDGRLSIRFALDFRNERLRFDLANGLFGRDDQTVEAARHRVDASRFFRDMMLNGELQLWDADSGALISRLDALIPVNCYIDLEGCNAAIDEAQADVDLRSSLAAEV